MLKEGHISFGLSDIVAIQLGCAHCPNEIVLRPGAECMPILKQCANCGASWIQLRGGEKIILWNQL